VLNGWANEVGFKTAANGIDYNTEYLTKYVTQQGKHDGWLYRRGAVSSPDPVDFYVWRYWSKSGATSGALGYDVAGKGDQSGDPEVDTLIEKALAETDANKQKTFLHDLQRYLGKMQYGVPHPGNASTFDLVWPVTGNFRVHQNDSRGGTTNLLNSFFYTAWVDETKEPIKKPA
jgi:ABC-type transport system substrate-binding protein